MLPRLTWPWRLSLSSLCLHTLLFTGMYCATAPVAALPIARIVSAEGTTPQSLA